jgi:hypothetical protein
VKIEEDIEDGFDARQYVHLLKKWTITNAFELLM